MKKNVKRRLLAATAVVSMAALSACSSAEGETATGGSGESDAPFIALSNGFIGNSWRQTLVRSFEETAEQLKTDGVISGYQAVNAPGDNDATEQISQIRSLILQDPDALLIVPASPTALVPVIEEACAADITVVVLDSEIDAPCAHVVRNSYDDWGRESTVHALEAIGGKGNIINNRGVVGSQPEQLFYATQQEIFAEYPDVKVVSEVNGFCDSGTTQQELVGILASMPEIAAVPGCASGMGVAQAFQSAGREVPVVVFDTSGANLQYWKDSGIDNGSYATITDPGQSVAALYVALELLDGKEVPEELILPLVYIPMEDRDAWLATLGPDDYAAYPWTSELIQEQIEAVQNGTEAPRPPTPAA
ncbi:substrate-binding domain-containing protein [Georgenia ruanii]|uniref:substrate-binding domain-containing protein n=1 Tax=Georgenia ruanii TaxID=348442 RepID=UPI0012648B9E|nr:substrate-binding domain-containing protein [Georgenia ruanii]